MSGRTQVPNDEKVGRQKQKDEISDRLKSMRKSLGMTQLQMAKELDISQGVYASYETGRRMPSMDVINFLDSKAFSLNYLFCGTGDIMLRQTTPVDIYAAFDRVLGQILTACGKAHYREKIIPAARQSFDSIVRLTTDRDARSPLDLLTEYEKAVSPLTNALVEVLPSK